MEAAGGGHCHKTLPVNQRVAWEGCSVLLDINDGDRLVFARLSSGASLKIGNKKCSLRPLIGSPFGSLFSVKAGPSGSYLARCAPSTFNENDRQFTYSGTNVRGLLSITYSVMGNASNSLAFVGEVEFCTASTLQDKDYWQSAGESKDNRSLIDNNTAQGLSSEDINAMKRECATGDDIVTALIANSSTFEKKTLYSQEKYMVKKQKKYAPKVLLRRPFSRR
ncbi:hypothetical protein AXF42_Ash000860 [Apostasia shenzhenica]|uniref:tRNA (adenine(58)-N(1))-methyltransferase non-catalytic subunit TRM6 n=1 Tax=Apostasia shenzhenica TaxID=1088818 RepID=A0A2I0ATA5_9ASPA|nr:hypothetical protein AXF42_Ash000860 [Apostasia shenzhenica]